MWLVVITFLLQDVRGTRISSDVPRYHNRNTGSWSRLGHLHINACKFVHSYLRPRAPRDVPRLLIDLESICHRRIRTYDDSIETSDFPEMNLFTLAVTRDGLICMLRHGAKFSVGNGEYVKRCLLFSATLGYDSSGTARRQGYFTYRSHS